jgi:hypothetical protein
LLIFRSIFLKDISKLDVAQRDLVKLMKILGNYFGKHGTSDTRGVPAAGENCGNGAALAPLRAGSVGPAKPLIFRKIHG